LPHISPIRTVGEVHWTTDDGRWRWCHIHWWSNLSEASVVTFKYCSH